MLRTSLYLGPSNFSYLKTFSTSAFEIPAPSAASPESGSRKIPAVLRTKGTSDGLVARKSIITIEAWIQRQHSNLQNLALQLEVPALGGEQKDGDADSGFAKPN